MIMMLIKKNDDIGKPKRSSIRGNDSDLIKKMTT